MKKDNKGKDFFETLWSTKPIRQTIRVGLLILIIALIAPLIFNNPAIFEQYNFEKYGEIARSFGGYLGPFIALIATLLTFMAFYIQYLANEKISQQFEKQQANNHFYKMLDIHVKYVDNLIMNSFRTDDEIKSISFFKKKKKLNDGKKTFTRSIRYFVKEPSKYDKMKINYSGMIPNGKIKSEKLTVKGINIFNLLIKDFHFIYYLIKNYNDIHIGDNKLCKDQIIKLTYRFFFWGTNSKHIHTEKIEENIENKIDKYLHNIRKQFRDNKGEKYHFSYKTIEGKNKHTFRFIPLSGHSIRLARYYRHLYQTVVHLHNTYMDNVITKKELNNNLNTLRAQLTNEEQLLLYYNYIAGFGENWDKNGNKGYKFLSEYRMIHNIPLYNTIPEDIDNPEVHFKKFIKEKKNKNPGFKMFEWSR